MLRIPGSKLCNNVTLTASPPFLWRATGGCGWSSVKFLLRSVVVARGEISTETVGHGSGSVGREAAPESGIVRVEVILGKVRILLCKVPKALCHKVASEEQ